jgi:phosphoglycolate phosphatase-like HAD superfamily hydrolase
MKNIGRMASPVDHDLQAIVFDCDGVLIESVDVKTEAFGALYESEGPNVVAEVRKYHMIHGGKSRYEKFRYFEESLLGRGAPTADRIAELDQRFSSLVEDRVIASPAVRGSVELLRFLDGRMGVHLVSATPEAELVRIVHARGWKEWFASVSGSPSAKHENVLHVLTSMSYDPSQVLLIGDSESDFDSATRCGTRFLGRVPLGSKSPFPSHIACVPDMWAVLSRFLALKARQPIA